MLRWLLSLWLLCAAGPVLAKSCDWPAWESFREQITADGRVVDYSTPGHITTSEGQSYAMFFALVADDRDSFAKLLRWTENNLTTGGLQQELPAWLWGRAEDGSWGIQDSNNASDSDLWIAYSLLEAGRLWNMPEYSALGEQLLWRSTAGTVRKLPGLGLMLLPADQGFESEVGWRLNPSYLPPQLLERFAGISSVWREIADNSSQFLIDSAPLGFAPDWVLWNGQEVEFSADSEGSYDAIRVYLWLGMLAEQHPQREQLQKHFAPMAQHFLQSGVVPEKVDVLTGELSGTGPVGFRASLLPYLTHQAEGAELLLQQVREELQKPLPETVYYSRVLSLFASGWDQGHYHFDEQGLLHTARRSGTCR